MIGEYSEEDKKEKYKFIIENTIIETNRVLYHWTHGGGNKMKSYEDKLSLFRSNLAKYFKVKFGYTYYNQNIRWHNPLFKIDNNLLIGISFSDLSTSTRQIEDLIKFCKDFDFITFNIKNPVDTTSRRLIESSPEDLLMLTDPKKVVNYDKIKNIKF